MKNAIYYLLWIALTINVTVIFIGSQILQSESWTLTGVVSLLILSIAFCVILKLDEK